MKSLKSQCETWHGFLRKLKASYPYSFFQCFVILFSLETTRLVLQKIWSYDSTEVWASNQWAAHDCSGISHGSVLLSQRLEIPVLVHTALYTQGPD